MAKISISFKKNAREKELYDYFSNLEDKSGDIKIILQHWYDNNIKKEKEAPKEPRKIKDIRDF